jgi:integrase
VNVPNFHGFRHTALMECEDAEEARDLARHKNSNVTRAVYRAHFTDKRYEALRATMEARMEAAHRSPAQLPTSAIGAESA